MFCGDLQANTVTTITIGPALDKDDADTEKTGLTIQDTDVYLSKNGGAKANPNDTNDCTEDANGVYRKQLNATDLNTEGLLTVYIHFTDCLYIRQDYCVLSQAAYASKYGAKDSGYMDVNVKAVSEDTVAADNLESACDNYSATRGLAGTALPDAAADAAGGLPISDLGGLDLDTLLAELGASNLPADVDTLLTRLSAIRAGYLDELDFNLQSAIAALPDAAAINAEVDTALSDIKLDKLLASGDADVNNIVADTSALAWLMAIGGDISDFDDTTDALEALGTRIIAILTDTDELELDWTDGGRLDLLLDAIKAKTDLLSFSGANVQSELAAIDAGVAGTYSSIGLLAMIDRIYCRLAHKVNVTDSDGSAAIRNAADSGDIATGSITDNSVTTVQAKWTWV